VPDESWAQIVAFFTHWECPFCGVENSTSPEQVDRATSPGHPYRRGPVRTPEPQKRRRTVLRLGARRDYAEPSAAFGRPLPFNEVGLACLIASCLAMVALLFRGLS